MFRSQHVEKQMKDVTKGELQFGIICVPNRASVSPNEKMNWAQFEPRSARLPIQLRVQQYSREKKICKLNTKFKFQQRLYQFTQKDS